MPVDHDQMMKFKEEYPEYQITFNPQDVVDGKIYAIIAHFNGIKGGNGLFRNKKIEYECYIDLTYYPEEYPEVWILNIPDAKIKHVNIFHPHPCSRLGKSLPKLCTTNVRKVSDRPNFSAIVFYISNVLNKQNFDDIARNPE